MQRGAEAFRSKTSWSLVAPEPLGFKLENQGSIGHSICMKTLSNHKILGIDLDGTLFQHQNTPILAEYIRINPYDQEFHIVTFRSHGMEDTIDDELSAIGLNRNHFSSVNNVDDKTYEEYEIARHIGHNPEAIERYLTWKGRICHEVGATALLDDMADLVTDGCKKYGIEHYHPDDLQDWR